MPQRTGKNVGKKPVIKLGTPPSNTTTTLTKKKGCSSCNKRKNK